MTPSKLLPAAAAGALMLAAAPLAAAQTPYQSTTGQNTTTQQQPSPQQERIGAILGALFGDRLGVSGSLDSQWAIGRRPLQTQRTQFISRIDGEVRAGTLSQYNGERMKREYDEVVALETRYAADGRFTTQERTDLADRYGAITQALNDGGYAGGSGSTTLNVANGRAAFDQRVDAAVNARRLSRTDAWRLKSDYAALVTVEAGYARDGLSASEQQDLDARLDALDLRVGDTQYGGGGSTVLDPRTRLSNIERALPNTTDVRNQILVEHGDLVRLEAAYSRLSPSADERAYLERRIGDLEVRARIRR